VVEEHLEFGKKEWLILRFEDNSKLTINRKYCKEVQDDEEDEE
jgi:hypothetical protein